MSVLVSVLDTLPLKPLLHKQLGMEARVGIEQRPQSKFRIRLLEINGLRH